MHSLQFPPLYLSLYIYCLSGFTVQSIPPSPLHLYTCQHNFPNHNILEATRMHCIVATFRILASISFFLVETSKSNIITSLQKQLKIPFLGQQQNRKKKKVETITIFRLELPSFFFSFFFLFDKHTVYKYLEYTSIHHNIFTM